MQLQIKHEPSSDNKLLFVVMCDGQPSQPVTLTSPEEVLVGSHNKNLKQDLQWYLEDYLELPIYAYCTYAEDVQTVLSRWGRDCFEALFADEPARDWYCKAQQEGLANLQLVIVSADPAVLAWPWEALKSPDGFLAQQCTITRQRDQTEFTQPVIAALPGDRLNILYIISRPTDESPVEFQALARPIVDFVGEGGWPVHIDVLRPPTYDKLKQVLKEKPNFYHIIHFDGHGKYVPDSGGILSFELSNGSCDDVEATELGELLRDRNIPLVVLNACQSAMQDEDAGDSFASVATELLEVGIPSVVAMSYGLWISGAKVFVPAFYQQLFESGDVAKAMFAARQAMYNNKLRDTFAGQVELYDWIVPVHYQQTTKIILPKLKPNAIQTSKLPNDTKILDKWGFIGRDQTILQLEHAIREYTAGILIHGMAGEGKTTAVKGFLQWLDATHGLGKGVFWFSFQDILSAEYIINTLIGTLFGTQTQALPTKQKLGILTKELKSNPYFIVWDNFESASGIPNTAVFALLSKNDRNLLKNFLQGLHGGKTKVLITSRSQENWLSSQGCCRLPLFGLKGEEFWRYCNVVVSDLNLMLDRKSMGYKNLMDKSNGNPLVARGILRQLKEKSTTELLTEIEDNFNDSEVNVALLIFEKGLSQTVIPVLRIIGLHEHYVDLNFLRDMLNDAENAHDLIVECVSTLETAGLCHHTESTTYQIHPTIHKYLTKIHPASDIDKRAFVNVMQRLILVITTYIARMLHEQRVIFARYSVCFYRAMKLAQELNMQDALLILTDALAIYAQKTCNFTEAEKLYKHYSKIAKKYNNILQEAVAFHRLGMVAEERRDFVAAENWYNKSIAVDKQLGDKSDPSSAFHQLGNVAFKKWDFVAAENWYNKSIAVDKQLGDEAGISKSYHQLGVIAEERRDFVAAENWYNKSLAIKERLIDEAGASLIYNQLGNVAVRRKKFAVAEHWYNKSLDIDKRLGDEASTSYAFHQLGLVAEEREDFDTAEKWYNKSLSIKERLGDEAGTSLTCHQLGRVAFRRKDFDTAEKWYNKSLSIKERLSDEVSTAKTYQLLGMVAEERRDFVTAEKWYNKTLTIKEKIGDKFGVALMYVLLYNVAFKREKFATAKDWCEKALKIFEQNGDQYRADILKQTITKLNNLKQQ
ncbi:MAG: tetratricopeptide repeat protein [Nitrososphaerota archaeon]|jgi:tetratricopeptide (TPR) repeat protein|nr:tetratricopeptide repeat protein [Nitrososphaerota archaeon]